MKEHKFIVMWCEEGLECIVPIDVELIKKYNDNLLISKFADDEEPDDEHVNRLCTTLQLLKFRAQVNSQRNYEIYILDTVNNIDEKYLRELFDDSPQMIVDLIREKGVKIVGHGKGKDSKPLIL
jgi:hypothetical protein